MRIIILVLFTLVIFSTPVLPEEGMWLLDSISKLPSAEMKKHGLELTPEQIYSVTGPSLKDAIVLLGGGTGSFISSEGLIITNHHVAFGSIQELSSVKDDYLKNGFLARTRAEELSTNVTAEIIETIRDVTGMVLSATTASMSPDERVRAIQAKQKEVEDSVHDAPGHFSKVVPMYDGAQYYLFTSIRLPDVRLVYAPPSSIGNFGGEVDNWTWPRHTGDFSIMRAYVGSDGAPAKYAKENVPFTPKKFLPISSKGYTEGSFAMIMGFPGRTYRYREASGIAFDRDETLPVTIDLYKARIDIITQAMNRDRATAIKYASALRRVANTYKKYAGVLQGMRRSNIVEVRKDEETRFAAYLASTPGSGGSSVSLLGDLAKATDDLRTVQRKSLMLTNILTGVNMLRLANRFAAYANTPVMDSLGNVIEPGEKQRGPIREFARGILKDTDPDVDKQICTALLLKSAAMPPEHQLNVVKEITDGAGGAKGERKIREFVDDLYEESSLTTMEGCDNLLEKSPRKINKNALVEFARKLAVDQSPVQAKVQSLTSTLSRLRGNYVAAWMEWKKNDLTYPDGNRTLRFTYGKVLPLSPRDGVHYAYATTLTGVIEKDTGEDPFLVPSKLKNLWQTKDYGTYIDNNLHDIPVAFITDNDITGGNSGSPVINGKGELIGCAFDGNWDGLVGDYFYQEETNRTISVDARYVLFLLEKYSGAEHLLKEMVIR